EGASAFPYAEKRDEGFTANILGQVTYVTLAVSLEIWHSDDEARRFGVSHGSRPETVVNAKTANLK
ncbi:MAG: hypothetical protein KDB23_33350, partial [Planctomycetales bacterium]|nr:hypothetical protein [Planctomycetales bacterium]